MSLRASPSRLRGTPARDHRHELDFLDAEGTRLVCLACRAVPIVLIDAKLRPSTLRTLRGRGELRGRALIESNGGTHAGSSPS
jgi:hypothetical protein